MSGFGFFFSFGGGFGKARLDFSRGLSNGGFFSGFLDDFFSLGGAVAFRLSLSWNASKSFFHPALGMSGSFLGKSISAVGYEIYLFYLYLVNNLLDSCNVSLQISEVVSCMVCQLHFVSEVLCFHWLVSILESLEDSIAHVFELQILHKK